jgi:hypothetical protein
MLEWTDCNCKKRKPPLSGWCTQLGLLRLENYLVLTVRVAYGPISVLGARERRGRFGLKPGLGYSCANRYRTYEVDETNLFLLYTRGERPRMR